MKKPKQKRSRRRNRPQHSRKGAKRQSRPPSSRSTEPRVQMARIDFAGTEAHEDDDCPCCRALRELGLDENGSITMSQYEGYMARVEEIIEQEGMPEGMIRGTGEDLARLSDLSALKDRSNLN